MSPTICIGRGSLQQAPRLIRAMLGALVVGLGFGGSGCGTRLALVDDSSRAAIAEQGGRQGARQGPGVAVQWWVSSEDGQARLAPQPDVRFHPGLSPGRDGIQLDDTITYQQVLGLGSSLDWSLSYNAWVTMIDHQGKPNVSGFHDSDPTVIVLNRDTLETGYRADYFLYGQFMKFIQPGAVCVATTAPRGAPSNVAFRNPDGSLVLVAAHPGNTPRNLSVAWRGGVVTATLGPKSAATLWWTP